MGERRPRVDVAIERLGKWQKKCCQDDSMIR